MATGILQNLIGGAINGVGNAVKNFGNNTPSMGPAAFTNAVNSSPQVASLTKNSPTTSSSNPEVSVSSPTVLGVKAANPGQNVAPPTTTLTKSQTAPLIYQGTLGANQVNIGTAANPNIIGGSASGSPTSTSTGTSNPNVTQVPNQSQATLESQYNQSPFNTAVGGLAGAQLANKAITAQTQNQENQTAQQIAQLQQGANTQEQAYQTGMIAPRAQGLAQNIASTEANQQTALQGQLSNEIAAGNQALTGQAQTQAAQQAAGTLTAPQQNYPFVFNPSTGQYTNAATGGVVTPQNAAQEFLSGNISYDQAQQAVAYMGTTGNAQLLAAIQSQNPNANVNALQGQAAATQQNATTLGTVGTNIAAANQTALGTAATAANAQTIGSLTTKINTTQNASATIDSIANGLVPNMTATNFNPTSSPIGNQTFAQYFTEKNPAAQQGITQGLAEIKNQVSNIIASATGLTPTGVTAALGDIDFTSLNPQQLHDFLGYINSYAQSNIQASQQSIQTIQNGGIPSATPIALPVPAANSTGQAAVGTGATLAEGLVSKIVSSLGDAAAGAAGGAVAEGLASKVLQ